MARAMNTIPSSSSFSVSELSLSSSSELTITRTGAAARQRELVWRTGHPVGEGLGARTSPGAVVTPGWQWAGTVDCSHPTPPAPLVRTCKPRLPPVLPASCQGTFLCVFPLGASLLREMFFCKGRATSWEQLGPAPCKPLPPTQVALQARDVHCHPG